MFICQQTLDNNFEESGRNNYIININLSFTEIGAFFGHDKDHLKLNESLTTCTAILQYDEIESIIFFVSFKDVKVKKQIYLFDTILMKIIIFSS